VRRSRLAWRLSAAILVTTSGTGWTSAPAGSAAASGSSDPGIRRNVPDIIPEPSDVRTGPGRVLLSKGVAISTKGASSGPVVYAAEYLRSELFRRFQIGATLIQDTTATPHDGVLVVMGETSDPKLMSDHAQLAGMPGPGPDGYLVGVFPGRREVVVAGNGGNGVIRGASALAQLTVADGGRHFWPQAMLSDTPEMEIRMTRGILFDGKVPAGMSIRDVARCELDWWARWGLNYTLLPARTVRGLEKDDAYIRWCFREGRRRGMKVGMNLGGRSLCPSDSSQMKAYLSKARHWLALGCDFLVVLFDDLPSKRTGGHCERCVEKFGGSLASEQRHVLEALQDVLAEFGSDRKLVWCPTYYSLGMTGYIGAAEGPEAYFTILGASAKVRKAWMYHCAFGRDFTEYLDGKGLTRRIWWYNGIRTYYYMVSRRFDGYHAWGEPLRIPGLKDFQSFFSPFEHGWLMPTSARADPSLHPSVSPLVPASRDERDRTVIPSASWQELAHLPERMDGLYLCGSSTPYHTALAAIFAAHPRRFDQPRAERAVMEAMFGRGGADYATSWQAAYSQAQMILARAEGSPLTGDPLRAIRDLSATMAAMETNLRSCAKRGSPALPTSFLAPLLDEMSSWRRRIRSLAGAP